MTFGSENGTVGRRKTSQVNKRFRKYLTEVISELIGISLNERTALTIFKVITRTPMRFLMTLEEESFDKLGERSLALSSVGRFKIINTVPHGKKCEIVGESGKYPRYKFYPSLSLEAEVEILNGLENPDSRVTYERTIESEKANIEQNCLDTAKILRRVMEEAGKPIKVGPETPRDTDLGTLFTVAIQDIVHKELQKLGITSVSQKDIEEDMEEDMEEDIEEDMEEDVEEDVEEDIEDTEEDIEEVKIKKPRKKKDPITDSDNIDLENSSKTSISERPTNAMDTLTDAIDDFDFDFNT